MIKVIKTFSYGENAGPYKLRAINEAHPTYAKNLGMEYVVIPAHDALEPHSHEGYETGIFVISGKGIVKYGTTELDQEVKFSSNDFIYIPPKTFHQPINTEDYPIAAVIARNTPYEVVERLVESKK